MERDGWIERRRDRDDQRMVRIYLTGKARALREDVRLSFQELDRGLMSVLRADERDDLAALLLKVHGYLSPAVETSDPHRPPQGDRNDNKMEYR
jgi:DNA-binding MarR family transcriptional regulator